MVPCQPETDERHWEGLPAEIIRVIAEWLLIPGLFNFDLEVCSLWVMVLESYPHDTACSVVVGFPT